MKKDPNTKKDSRKSAKKSRNWWKFSKKPLRQNSRI